MSRTLGLEKKSLDVRAADAIRQKIVRGLFAPGERLTEIRLADELDISRGTVRAALQRLAADGLVELIAYTGWSVTPLTARGAWELFTLRSSLEALAARLAAAAIAPSQGVTLANTLKKLDHACASGKLHDVADADFELHHRIIDISGHVRLKQQYAVLEDQIRLYIASSDALLPTTEAVVAQHRPLVEAILAKDSNEAARIARDHAVSEGKALVQSFLRRERDAGASSDPGSAQLLDFGV